MQSKDEIVAAMADIYEANTQDGFTSPVGVGLIAEKMMEASGEDRMYVIHQFENHIRESNCG